MGFGGHGRDHQDHIRHQSGSTDTGGRRHPFGIWAGERVFVVASGPSLTAQDAEKLKGEKTIVVNTTASLMPWASALYAADIMWWENNQDIWHGFAGFKFTWCKVASDRFGLMHSPGKQAPGLGKDILHAGGSSAYMAVNLAYLMGAKRICLLGFDMQYTDGKSHWHGDHKNTGNPPKHELAKWAERFVPLWKDLDSVGVTMINCTRETALTIPRRDLDEELQ